MYYLLERGCLPPRKVRGSLLDQFTRKRTERRLLLRKKGAPHKGNSLERKKGKLDDEPALVGPPPDEAEAAERAHAFGLEQLRLTELKAKRDDAKELAASQRRRNAARGKKNRPQAKTDPKPKPHKNDKLKPRKSNDKKHTDGRKSKIEGSPRSRRPSHDTRRVSVSSSSSSESSEESKKGA